MRLCIQFPVTHHKIAGSIPSNIINVAGSIPNVPTKLGVSLVLFLSTHMYQHKPKNKKKGGIKTEVKSPVKIIKTPMLH